MKINIDKNWEFCLENKMDGYNRFGFWKVMGGGRACEKFLQYNNWDKVNLPHDWAISLPIDNDANHISGGRANSKYNMLSSELVCDVSEVFNVGWYRKTIDFLPEWEGKRIFLEFEGIYRDSVVWVNGTYMLNHTSGYTPIYLEITDYLTNLYQNSITVRADTSQTEGWWYDGAGIYRHAFLHIVEPVYFKRNQTVIKSKTNGEVQVSAIVVNDTDCTENSDTLFEIIDKNGACVAKTSVENEYFAHSEKQIKATLNIENPTLWDLENPYLYTLRITLGKEKTEEKFGIREAVFDADKGFLLNGKQVKLRGASVHQDFGGVGVALTDNLNYYKIKKLKEMGCNAYRTAHNPPSPALLCACDELGMLVMDEVRTFGSSPMAVDELVSLIERDRNHPSVVIWSLGNEENDIQNNEIGIKLMQKATRLAKSLDDRAVTYGANNGENFTGINKVAEVRGINYIHGRGSAEDFDTWIDRYHAMHPTQPIVGTEETSNFSSRGSMINDIEKGLVDCTGQVCAAWGTTPRGFVKFSEEREYFAGAFMWTGFDYRGEPTPFGNTNFSSTFGAIDLCGMEKPPFYYYKAWWTDDPVLKILPHWNYKSGEKARVVVFTNCERITLKLNGKVIVEQEVEKYDEPIFELDYKRGELEVVGTKNGITYTDKLETSGKTKTVKSELALGAKMEDDVAIYEICGYDSKGRFCPTACEQVEISVKNGEIVGVGNGDPASCDYEQKPMREEAVYITSFDLDGEVYTVGKKHPNFINKYDAQIIRAGEEKGFTDGARYITRNASLTNFEQTLTCRIDGVDKFEYIEFERLGGKVRAYLNGKEIGNNLLSSAYANSSQARPYRFYCKFKKGENEIKITSERNEKTPPTVSGYIKIGKQVKDRTWTVRLHYGKARVFIKSRSPKSVRLSAKIKK